MLRKFLASIFLTLGMLLQASPAPMRSLQLVPAGLVPVSIPAGITSIPPLMQTDLDGNGSPETLSMTGGKLSIYSSADIVWQSPQAWQIVQAAISDLNHDKKPEVTLLLWRAFQPWPVDQWLPNGGRIAEYHNDEGQSCHIILIGWMHGGYRELWAGSAMADPITSFAVADLNGNNTQELVALEARYTELRFAPARTLKVWEWNGFGFTVVFSMDGMFNNMVLTQAIDGRILILVP